MRSTEQPCALLMLQGWETLWLRDLGQLTATTAKHHSSFLLSFLQYP